MYKINKYGTELVFSIENGLYVFDNESAIGKTRLCKALRECQKYGEPVASYTYDDKLLNMHINSILVPNKYKVIMLDRYDMYNGDGAELIKECAKNSIVLIDCKSNLAVSTDDEWCSIQMEPNRIEVVQMSFSL